MEVGPDTGPGARSTSVGDGWLQVRLTPGSATEARLVLPKGGAVRVG